MVNAALKRHGHIVAPAAFVPSFGRLVNFLERHRLTPAAVFDIGVADGTPWLYAAYPEAKYYLIDPTREAVPHMQRWARRLDAEIFNVALGESDGVLTIDVGDDLGGSSLFSEIGPYRSVSKYEVPVCRFDTMIGDFSRPSLCKIDVQGAELMVLRGMGDRLREIDIFVVETSLIATLGGGAPEIADVIAHMRRYNFVLYDIVACLCLRTRLYGLTAAGRIGSDPMPFMVDLFACRGEHKDVVTRRVAPAFCRIVAPTF